MDSLEVVSAIITCISPEGKRLLLCQRPPSKDYPFTWESPGGKVEGSESHHEALGRELREEIGVEVAGIEMVPTWSGKIKRGGRPDVYLHLYRTLLATGSVPRPMEGQGIGWFTMREVDAMRLIPGNRLAMPTFIYNWHKL